MYRENAFPAVGLIGVKLMMGSEHEQVTLESSGAKMSSSGQLYYSFSSKKHANVVEYGIYVMIWRVNMNGDWKPVLNLQKKLPPKS